MKRGGLKSGLLCLAVALLALSEAHFPQFMIFTYGDPEPGARNRVIWGLYDSLKEHGATPRDSIYLTTTGYVNYDTINYLAACDELKPFLFTDGEAVFTDDLSVHAAAIARADYVIASAAGNDEAFTFFKSGEVQDQTLAVARADPLLEQIGEFPTLNGKSYYLFQRATGFKNLEFIDGITAPIGPIPRWNLKVVRWAESSQTRFRSMGSFGGHGSLTIDARSEAGRIPAHVLVDGREIASPVFDHDIGFQTFNLPLDLSAGRHEFTLATTCRPRARGSRTRSRSVRSASFPRMGNQNDLADSGALIR